MQAHPDQLFSLTRINVIMYSSDRSSIPDTPWVIVFISNDLARGLIQQNAIGHEIVLMFQHKHDALVEVLLL
jgi:hypothetical protein